MPKSFPKLRHTASTMVSLVPGLGSRKFATQVVYLSLASLGLVAANSRLHASFTFYVRNPNLVRFFQNFFQKIFPKFFAKFFPKFFQYFFQKFFAKFFPKFFQYFFQKFLPKFFPKLFPKFFSKMVSLVPGLGSRKFATRVVYLSLASLGLVAANSRLHASFTFYVRNPNLVRLFQNFSKNFFGAAAQYFFPKFLPNCFQNCDTRLLQWYLWSLGLVAANSRLRLCTCPLRLWAW